MILGISGKHVTETVRKKEDAMCMRLAVDSGRKKGKRALGFHKFDQEGAGVLWLGGPHSIIILLPRGRIKHQGLN